MSSLARVLVLATASSPSSVAIDMLDHDVVDGAPAARFAARLRSIVESGDLLDRAGESGRASAPPSSSQGRS